MAFNIRVRGFSTDNRKQTTSAGSLGCLQQREVGVPRPSPVAELRKLQGSRVPGFEEFRAAEWSGALRSVGSRVKRHQGFLMKEASYIVTLYVWSALVCCPSPCPSSHRARIHVQSWGLAEAAKPSKHPRP